MDYASTLHGPDKVRYERKLQVVFAESGMEVIDPYFIAKEKWKDDVYLWPPVEFGQLYTYLVDTPGPYTKEKLKAYKNLEAFNYYIRYCSI